MKITLLAVDAIMNSRRKRREGLISDCEFTKFQVSNKYLADENASDSYTSCRYGSVTQLIRQIFPRTPQNTRVVGEMQRNFGCFRVNYISMIIKPEAG